MADTITKAKRSRVMAAIRSRGNQETEVKFVAILRSCRITRWRGHQALPGRPDFVFRAERLAIFVDGCSGMAAAGIAECPRATAITGGERLPATSNEILQPFAS